MKKFVSLVLVTAAALIVSGCARPFELGWGPAHTADDRGREIARNWDYEGKQIVDDIDHILLLRPATRLTLWNVR
jgi:hypothetical protein